LIDVTFCFAGGSDNSEEARSDERQRFVRKLIRDDRRASEEERGRAAAIKASVKAEKRKAFAAREQASTAAAAKQPPKILSKVRLRVCVEGKEENAKLIVVPRVLDASSLDDLADVIRSKVAAAKKYRHLCVSISGDAAPRYALTADYLQHWLPGLSTQQKTVRFATRTSYALLLWH